MNGQQNGGNVRLSVAMAVYNGEAYLKEQVDSILAQLGENDELILSVDSSTDASDSIAREYAGRDGRVSIYTGPGRGAIRNFESALGKTSGEYIFLSDQDDVWAENKVTLCLDALKRPGVLAVIHNAILTDETLRRTGEKLLGGRFFAGAFRNILQNKYTGCCMAFKRELLFYALPFPNSIPMHDQWLGIVANKYGAVEYIDSPLLYYRRHGTTVTGREKAGITKKLRWRMGILYSYIRLGKKKPEARSRADC